MSDARSKLPKIGRDSLIFAGGLAGVFHETVIAEAERPTLLVLFATMLGLPAFLRSDEKKTEVPHAPPAPAPPADPPAPAAETPQG